MSKFKGTKDDWRVIDATPTNGKNIHIKNEGLIAVIDSNNETVCICGRKESAQIANAELIADAGTTINKCDLMPSELLKQRNEMLEMLKELSRHHQGGHSEIGFKIKQILTKVNQ